MWCRLKLQYPQQKPSNDKSAIASGQSILDDAINNFGKPIAKVITDPKINKALLYGAITGSAVAASRPQKHRVTLRSWLA